MRNMFWGMVLITLGVLFLLDNMGVADFGDIVSRFWPLLLVFWGISVLVRRRRPQTTYTSAEGFVGSATIASQVTEDLIHHSTVFGDFFAAIVATDFKGGSISTVFGDCNVDLSKATFAEGEHILRIHSVFGDSTIVLPKDAAVFTEARTVFGDVVSQDQRKGGFSAEVQSMSPSYLNADRKLKLTVTKVFGDIRIS